MLASLNNSFFFFFFDDELVWIIQARNKHNFVYLLNTLTKTINFIVASLIIVMVTSRVPQQFSPVLSFKYISKS